MFNLYMKNFFKELILLIAFEINKNIYVFINSFYQVTIFMDIKIYIYNVLNLLFYYYII